MDHHKHDEHEDIEKKGVSVVKTWQQQMADGRVEKGGEKNADDKMRKEKYGWKNKNDIRTRGNKFTMCSYILSGTIKPREFRDQNIFSRWLWKKWN